MKVHFIDYKIRKFHLLSYNGSFIKLEVHLQPRNSILNVLEVSALLVPSRLWSATKFKWWKCEGSFYIFLQFSSVSIIRLSSFYVLHILMKMWKFTCSITWPRFVCSTIQLIELQLLESTIGVPGVHWCQKRESIDHTCHCCCDAALSLSLSLLIEIYVKCVLVMQSFFERYAKWSCFLIAIWCYLGAC
jgi:hypothetical protein